MGPFFLSLAVIYFPARRRVESGERGPTTKKAPEECEMWPNKPAVMEKACTSAKCLRGKGQ